MLGSCVLLTLVALASSVASAAGKPTRRTVVVPAKTPFDVRLATAVSSESNRPDDPVLATLATPVIVDGVIVAPVASVLLGNVFVADGSASSGDTRKIALRFDRLRVGPMTYDIRTAPVRISNDDDARDDDNLRLSSGTRLRLELLEPVSIEVQRLR
ncbi:MAG: hypothetical protein ACRD2A_03325 [Vicinamibacterales bacterium]